MIIPDFKLQVIPNSDKLFDFLSLFFFGYSKTKVSSGSFLTLPLQFNKNPPK